MKPTSKQVEEVSEVLALLMEDFSEEASCGVSAPAPEGEEQLSEEALARIVAKSLAARDGDGQLRGLLGAARGILRGLLEEGGVSRIGAI